MYRTLLLFWLPLMACAAVGAAPVQALALASDCFDSSPAEEGDGEEADDFCEIGLPTQRASSARRPIRTGLFRPATNVARWSQVPQASPQPVLRNGLGAPLRR
jgi:hypothetical protein